MSNPAQKQGLLKEAETVISALLDEKAAHEDFVQELQSRLISERREVDRLFSRLKKLERALGDVEQERDDVRTVLQSLRSDMRRIRNVATETLRHVSDKASVMNMAVKFYDVKTLAARCVHKTG